MSPSNDGQEAVLGEVIMRRSGAWSLLLAVISVVVLGSASAGVGSQEVGAAGTTPNPCKALKPKPVETAFDVEEIATVTRGKGDFSRSCFFTTPIEGDSCVSQLAVFITTQRHKSAEQAAESYAEISAAGQSLPKGTVPTGKELVREELVDLGDGAYYTNRRLGVVVVLDGKRVRAFGGGFTVSSSSTGCDLDALGAENRASLEALARRLTPTSPKSDAVETISGVLGGERENTDRRGAPCLWVDADTARVEILMGADTGQAPLWVNRGPFEGVIPHSGGDLLFRAGDHVTATGTRTDARQGCGDRALVLTEPLVAAP